MSDMASGQVFVIPLPGGRRWLTLDGPFPLSQEEWAIAEGILTAMLPGLVKPVDPEIEFHI